METRREVKTFRVEKYCEKCMTGYMIFTGNTYRAGKKVAHIHKCDKCDVTEEYPDKKYPYIEYE